MHLVKWSYNESDKRFKVKKEVNSYLTGDGDIVTMMEKEWQR